MAGLIVLTVFAACNRTDQPAQAALTAPKTIEDHFAIKVGDCTVSMQVAATQEEMEKGLMFRQTLGANEGMLFIYETPQQMNFWMRNTEIPLNIGYFDAAGELRETYEMYPHDEKTVSSHSQALKYALEMNPGWFSHNGLKAGAKLDLQAVAGALKARGLKTEEAEQR